MIIEPIIRDALESLGLEELETLMKLNGYRGNTKSTLVSRLTQHYLNKLTEEGTQDEVKN